MTRIGIPEQQEFYDMSLEQYGQLVEAADAARDVLRTSGVIPLEVFLARVGDATGGETMHARHALHHLQANGEAMYRYGVGVWRPDWRRAA